MKKLIATVTVILTLALPASARQLDCEFDSFGSSTDLVRFTPETDAQERHIIWTALDTTAYDTAALVKELGHPLLVSVNGFQSFAFASSGTIVLADHQSISDLMITLMHEIGHVHDRAFLTEADRGMPLDHWLAFDIFYFDRPAEQYAFAFSREFKPCAA